MRKTETCRRVFELANYCAENYYNYSFNNFRKPADEPVIALGMAVCNCKPIDDGFGEELLFAPNEKSLKINVAKGEASYLLRNGTTIFPTLIHWGNYKTRKSVYRFEVAKMKQIIEHKEEGNIYKVLYDKKLLYYFFYIQDAAVFCGRLYRKAQKVMKEKLEVIQ